MNKVFNIQTNNEQCTIKAFVQTASSNQPVIARFRHSKQPNTVYYEHLQNISGKGYFYIRLPQSPEYGILEIESKNAFTMPKIPYEILPLNQKLDAFNYKNPLMKEAINFFQWFCEDFSVLSSRGSAFQSKGTGLFRIDVHDVLIHRIGNMAGKDSRSPARIGRDTKIMEIARKYFIGYTIPERFCILAHEFGHGFLNKKAESEFEADRASLDICLGLGYPRSAIKKVYIKVFTDTPNGHPTESNLKRWQLIKDYVDNFAKGDVYEDYYYSQEKR